MPLLERIRGALQAIGCEAGLVSNLSHVRYLSGFSGSSAAILLHPGRTILCTDARYSSQARQETQGLEIIIGSGSPVKVLYENGLFNKLECIAVEGRSTVASDLTFIQSRLGLDRVSVVDEWLEPVVAPKSRSDTESIRKAQAITDRVFEDLPGIITPGITEKQLASEIICRHLRYGSEKMSFDPIVAFGENSSFPHARPTDRVLGVGDSILVDFGCVVDGFASDMTRMLSMGKPTAEFISVFDTVHLAKTRAVESIREGVGCAELDQVARLVIDQEGYGDRFLHGLGHGVGLNVHEWPSVSSRSKTVLADGFVITIEPGIYLEGKFGIRIEDMVQVKSDGVDIITGSPSELVVVEPD